MRFNVLHAKLLINRLLLNKWPHFGFCAPRAPFGKASGESGLQSGGARTGGGLVLVRILSHCFVKVYI